MRIAYSLIFYLLIPFILLRLLWRSIKAPDYRQRWRERFACYDRILPQNIIWFHAVSVGEAEALFPLIRRLQQKKPHEKIVVTTTTPTGSVRVLAVLGQSVEHVYLPYDTPDIVKRFLRVFKPKLAVIMETEIWPNLFTYCGKNDIPLYVINARLSEKSARGYQKIPALIHSVFDNVKLVATQTQEDAERYIAIGANPNRVKTVGNIKFDIEVPEEIIVEGKQLKESELKDRFVWIAASTHQGEEQIFLDAYKEIKNSIPELLLLIVPRHPERFPEVGALCTQNALTVINRTSKQSCNQEADVYLADTMGELKMLYAAADVAFIAGSMVAVGGHNLLEASAIGVPVLFGPYMANFKEIANKVLAYKAAIQCHDKDDIVRVIRQLHSDMDYRDLLVENGKEFIYQNRGALNRLCEILAEELS
jgi:3-deoxy-D-manno-octulosonic-acid transferase